MNTLTGPPSTPRHPGPGSPAPGPDLDIKELPTVNEQEITRIAVRASMACIGVTLACIMALFLMAAAVSPRINIPGIHVSHHITQPSGD